MKRIAIIVAAVLLGNVVSAQADQSIFHWYDTIRPHGHKRSDAIGEANVNTCNARVGIQYETVSPAFKECMRGLGYRYLYTTVKRTPKSRRNSVYVHDDATPVDNSSTSNDDMVRHQMEQDNIQQMINNQQMLNTQQMQNDQQFQQDQQQMIQQMNQ
jgi:hypothetical protein